MYPCAIPGCAALAEKDGGECAPHRSISRLNIGPKNGVWVGLKPCGCCVAVVVDDGEPEHKKDVEQSKREFLRDGLSVVHASWHDWQTKHLGALSSKCSHDKEQVAL